MPICNSWPPPIKNYACFSDIITFHNDGTDLVTLAPGITIAAGAPLDFTGFDAKFIVYSNDGLTALLTLQASTSGTAPVSEPTANGIWLLSGGRLQLFISNVFIRTILGDYTWVCLLISPAGNPYPLFEVNATVIA